MGSCFSMMVDSESFREDVSGVRIVNSTAAALPSGLPLVGFFGLKRSRV